MTFRPIDSTAFASDRALSAEHGRRIVRDTVEVINERCVQSGGAFRRYAGDGSELRTLWRWAANWGYIGPFHVFVPPQVAEQGYIRVLIGARTNEGDGNVRVYAINEARAPDEATMTANTASGAPVSEEEWYVCESDVGSGDFDFALRMPVNPGWNRCWIAILCDADADRTPVAFSGSDVDTTPFVVNGSTLPMVSLTGAANLDSVGMALEIAEDATAYAAGVANRYTVARSIVMGNGTRHVVWEPSLNDWVENVDRQEFAYAVRFYTVPIFIDSISFDGSCGFSFGSRGDAAPFRYLQPVSGGFTRAAVDDGQNAHNARLPITGTTAQLFTEVPAALDSTRGVPPQTYAISPTTTAQTIAAALLGIGAAIPTVEIQETFSGAYTYEVRLSILAIKRSNLRTGDSPVEFNLFADIVDAAGSSIALGDTVSVQVLPLINSSGNLPIETQTQSWVSRGATTGVLYGQESVLVRTDVGQWVNVTMQVTTTRNLGAPEPVQRLRVRALTPNGTIAGLTLLSSPAAVRLTDGS